MSAYGGFAVHCRGIAAERLIESVVRSAEALVLELSTVEDEVRASVAHDHRDQPGWADVIHRCHGRLCADLGDAVSMGYAVPRTGSGAARRALVEASDALRFGERVFGSGHLTDYGDAQLAWFLFAHTDPEDLRSLHERTVGRLLSEDRERPGDLVPTLHAYCESGCSLQDTARRLGVHRNTVLHRIKRIEALTLTNLADGPTRLLLQVGLVAGRLVRQPLAGQAL
jgi:purine catabolism regulator